MKRPLESKQEVSVFDNKDVKPIQNFVLNNSKNVFTLGPFKAEKKGSFEKTFKLGINGGDSVTLIGPKFGFYTNVIEPVVPKILNNRFRLELERIKKELKINLGIEYIIEKLK